MIEKWLRVTEEALWWRIQWLPTWVPPPSWKALPQMPVEGSSDSPGFPYRSLSWSLHSIYCFKPFSWGNLKKNVYTSSNRPNEKPKCNTSEISSGESRYLLGLLTEQCVRDYGKKHGWPCIRFAPSRNDSSLIVWTVSSCRFLWPLCSSASKTIRIHALKAGFHTKSWKKGLRKILRRGSHDLPYPSFGKETTKVDKCNCYDLVNWPRGQSYTSPSS